MQVVEEEGEEGDSGAEDTSKAQAPAREKCNPDMSSLMYQVD